MTDPALRLRRAQREARGLLRRLAIEDEAPVPIEDVAHALRVELVAGGVGNALASLLRVGEQRRIRLGDRHDHPGQLRYSIAHELGHALGASHPSSPGRVSSSRIGRGSG